MRNKLKSIKFLDFSKEYFKRKKLYDSAFIKVMSNGIYVLGDEVKTFEKEYAKFVHAKYCIGVANGLEALQISLMALGIGDGDEIITTPLSAVATTLSIIAVGAVPIFVDIKDNGQINEDLIENSLTKRTRAILPVHLYGQPAEIEKIKSICKKHKLFLIEDACQAHGTTYSNKLIGSFGDLACYSFYPTKNLGAIGDGGAITTNNEKLAKLIYQLRDYGQESKYKHIRYGLNSRLDELQASILRKKLNFLDIDNKRRRIIAKRYVKNLSNINGLDLILPKEFNDSNFHLFVIRTKERDQLKKFLIKNDISSLIHFPISIPDQPMFKGKYKKVGLPIVRQFVNEILSLPCHPLMNLDDVDYISGKIKEFFNV